MKIISGYDQNYLITEEGKIFSLKTNKYLKANKKHAYTIKDENGKYKSVSIKTLYQLAYGKNFCIDTIENLPDEKWEPVKDTGELYWVSNKGRVKSVKGVEAKLLKPYSNGRGYLRVDIFKGKDRYTPAVHRLVAESFLIGAKNHDMNYVHHIDKDTSNNCADNLMWVSEIRHKEIHKQMKREENQ